MKRLAVVLVALVATLVFMKVQMEKAKPGEHSEGGQMPPSQKAGKPIPMPPLKIREVKDGWTILHDGLRFTDLKVGTGKSPMMGDTVRVHYTGKLANGKKFDSSYDGPGNEPASFNINGVIKGWQEGLSTMKVGGKRILVIPPSLGYGSQGSGGKIPPNATLTFEVELVGIQAGMAPPPPPPPPSGHEGHDHGDEH